MAYTGRPGDRAWLPITSYRAGSDFNGVFADAPARHPLFVTGHVVSNRYDTSSADTDLTLADGRWHTTDGNSGALPHNTGEATTRPATRFSLAKAASAAFVRLPELPRDDTIVPLPDLDVQLVFTDARHVGDVFTVSRAGTPIGQILHQRFDDRWRIKPTNERAVKAPYAHWREAVEALADHPATPPASEDPAPQPSHISTASASEEQARGESAEAMTNKDGDPVSHDEPNPELAPQPRPSLTSGQETVPDTSPAATTDTDVGEPPAAAQTDGDNVGDISQASDEEIRAGYYVHAREDNAGEYERETRGPITWAFLRVYNDQRLDGTNQAGIAHDRLEPAPRPSVTNTPERREAERLQQRATELAASADRMSDRASGMYGRFAGGQPILVGHHSYRSAVRDRNRADNATRLAIEKLNEAKRAQQKAATAQAVADLADIESTRSRPWRREDFRPGDIVVARDFRRDQAITSQYVVKRANAKTLTLDGGGGGWDDPKRTYDRVLSRTRDGITITDPAQADGLVVKSVEPDQPPLDAASPQVEQTPADAPGRTQAAASIAHRPIEQALPDAGQGSEPDREDPLTPSPPPQLSPQSPQLGEAESHPVQPEPSPQAPRFTSIEQVREHLQTGGDSPDEGTQNRARELAARIEKVTMAGDGSFLVEKGKLAGPSGWLLRHTGTGLIVGGSVFATKSEAVGVAERAKTITTADGALFDWDSPGLDRINADISAKLHAARAEVERERDARRAEKKATTSSSKKTRNVRAEGSNPRFADTDAVRAHWRALAEDTSLPDEHRRAVGNLAEDSSLTISPGGSLVIIRRKQGEYRYSFAETGLRIPEQPFKDDPDRELISEWGSFTAARGLAARWEQRLIGLGGRPLDWDVPQLKETLSQWRSMLNERIGAAMWRVKGQWDAEGGHHTYAARDYTTNQPAPDRDPAPGGTRYADETAVGDMLVQRIAPGSSHVEPKKVTAISETEPGRFRFTFDDASEHTAGRNQLLQVGASPIVHDEGGQRIGERVALRMLRPGDRVQLTDIRAFGWRIVAGADDYVGTGFEATIPPGFRGETNPRLIDVTVLRDGDQQWIPVIADRLSLGSRVIRLDQTPPPAGSYTPAQDLAAAFAMPPTALAWMAQVDIDTTRQSELAARYADLPAYHLDRIATEARAVLDSADDEFGRSDAIPILVHRVHTELAALAAERARRGMGVSDAFVAGLNTAEEMLIDGDEPRDITQASDEEIRAGYYYASARDANATEYEGDLWRPISYAFLRQYNGRELDRADPVTDEPAPDENDRIAPPTSGPAAPSAPEAPQAPTSDTRPDAAAASEEQPGEDPLVATNVAHEHIEQVLVAAGHTAAGEDDFGYLLHRQNGDDTYLLLTCQPSKWWQTMPGEAVRTAIARHLDGYATTLNQAGYGAAMWQPGDQPRAVIIAVDQATAERLAPAIRTRLANATAASGPDDDPQREEQAATSPAPDIGPTDAASLNLDAGPRAEAEAARDVDLGVVEGQVFGTVIQLLASDHDVRVIMWGDDGHTYVTDSKTPPDEGACVRIALETAGSRTVGVDHDTVTVRPEGIIPASRPAAAPGPSTAADASIYDRLFTAEESAKAIVRRLAGDAARTGYTHSLRPYVASDAVQQVGPAVIEVARLFGELLHTTGASYVPPGRTQRFNDVLAALQAESVSLDWSTDADRYTALADAARQISWGLSDAPGSQRVNDHAWVLDSLADTHRLALDPPATPAASKAKSQPIADTAPSLATALANGRAEVTRAWERLEAAQEQRAVNELPLPDAQSPLQRIREVIDLIEEHAGVGGTAGEINRYLTLGVAARDLRESDAEAAVTEAAADLVTAAGNHEAHLRAARDAARASNDELSDPTSAPDLNEATTPGSGQMPAEPQQTEKEVSAPLNGSDVGIAVKADGVVRGLWDFVSGLELDTEWRQWRSEHIGSAGGPRRDGLPDAGAIQSIDHHADGLEITVDADTGTRKGTVPWSHIRAWLSNTLTPAHRQTLIAASGVMGDLVAAGLNDSDRRAAHTELTQILDEALDRIAAIVADAYDTRDSTKRRRPAQTDPLEQAQYQVVVERIRQLAGVLPYYSAPVPTPAHLGLGDTSQPSTPVEPAAAPGADPRPGEDPRAYLRRQAAEHGLHVRTGTIASEEILIVHRGDRAGLTYCESDGYVMADRAWVRRRSGKRDAAGVPALLATFAAHPDLPPAALRNLVNNPEAPAPTVAQARDLAGGFRLDVTVKRVGATSYITIHEPGIPHAPVLSYQAAPTPGAEAFHGPVKVPFAAIRGYLFNYRYSLVFRERFHDLAPALDGSGPAGDWRRRIAELAPHMVERGSYSSTKPERTIEREVLEALPWAHDGDIAAGEVHLCRAEAEAGGLTPSPDRRAELIRAIKESASPNHRATPGDVARSIAEVHGDVTERERDWIAVHIVAEPEVLNGEGLTPDQVHARRAEEQQDAQEEAQELTRQASKAFTDGRFEAALKILDATELAYPAGKTVLEQRRTLVRITAAEYAVAALRSGAGLAALPSSPPDPGWDAETLQETPDVTVASRHTATLRANPAPHPEAAPGTAPAEATAADTRAKTDRPAEEQQDLLALADSQARGQDSHAANPELSEPAEQGHSTSTIMTAADRSDASGPRADATPQTSTEGAPHTDATAAASQEPIYGTVTSLTDGSGTVHVTIRGDDGHLYTFESPAPPQEGASVRIDPGAVTDRSPGVDYETIWPRPDGVGVASRPPGAPATPMTVHGPVYERLFLAEESAKAAIRQIAGPTAARHRHLAPYTGPDPVMQVSTAILEVGRLFGELLQTAAAHISQDLKDAYADALADLQAEPVSAEWSIDAARYATLAEATRQIALVRREVPGSQLLNEHAAWTLHRLTDTHHEALGPRPNSDVLNAWPHRVADGAAPSNTDALTTRRADIATALTRLHEAQQQRAVQELPLMEAPDPLERIHEALDVIEGQRGAGGLGGEINRYGHLVAATRDLADDQTLEQSTRAAADDLRSAATGYEAYLRAAREEDPARLRAALFDADHTQAGPADVPQQATQAIPYPGGDDAEAAYGELVAVAEQLREHLDGATAEPARQLATALDQRRAHTDGEDLPAAISGWSDVRVWAATTADLDGAESAEEVLRHLAQRAYIHHGRLDAARVDASAAATGQPYRSATEFTSADSDLIDAIEAWQQTATASRATTGEPDRPAAGARAATQRIAAALHDLGREWQTLNDGSSRQRNLSRRDIRALDLAHAIHGLHLSLGSGDFADPADADRLSKLQSDAYRHAARLRLMPRDNHLLLETTKAASEQSLRWEAVATRSTARLEPGTASDPEPAPSDPTTAPERSGIRRRSQPQTGHTPAAATETPAAENMRAAVVVPKPGSLAESVEPPQTVADEGTRGAESAQPGEAQTAAPASAEPTMSTAPAAATRPGEAVETDRRDAGEPGPDQQLSTDAVEGSDSAAPSQSLLGPIRLIDPHGDVSAADFLPPSPIEKTPYPDLASATAAFEELTALAEQWFEQPAEPGAAEPARHLIEALDQRREHGDVADLPAAISGWNDIKEWAEATAELTRGEPAKNLLRQLSQRASTHHTRLDAPRQATEDFLGRGAMFRSPDAFTATDAKIITAIEVWQGTATGRHLSGLASSGSGPAPAVRAAMTRLEAALTDLASGPEQPAGRPSSERDPERWHDAKILDLAHAAQGLRISLGTDGYRHHDDYAHLKALQRHVYEYATMLRRTYNDSEARSAVGEAVDRQRDAWKAAFAGPAPLADDPTVAQDPLKSDQTPPTPTVQRSDEGISTQERTSDALVDAQDGDARGACETYVRYLGHVPAPHYASCTDCGFEGPARADENVAVEDGLDHAFPGWRELPVVEGPPDQGDPGGDRARARWEKQIRDLYPDGWFTPRVPRVGEPRGGPVLTFRVPIGTHHVNGRAPGGGYDVGVTHEGVVGPNTGELNESRLRQQDPPPVRPRFTSLNGLREHWSTGGNALDPGQQAIRDADRKAVRKLATRKGKTGLTLLEQGSFVIVNQPSGNGPFEVRLAGTGQMLGGKWEDGRGAYLFTRCLAQLRADDGHLVDWAAPELTSGLPQVLIDRLRDIRTWVENTGINLPPAEVPAALAAEQDRSREATRDGTVEARPSAPEPAHTEVSAVTGEPSVAADPRAAHGRNGRNFGIDLSVLGLSMEPGQRFYQQAEQSAQDLLDHIAAHRTGAPADVGDLNEMLAACDALLSEAQRMVVPDHGREYAAVIGRLRELLRDRVRDVQAGVPGPASADRQAILDASSDRTCVLAITHLRVGDRLYTHVLDQEFERDFLEVRRIERVDRDARHEDGEFHGFAVELELPSPYRREGQMPTRVHWIDEDAAVLLDASRAREVDSGRYSPAPVPQHRIEAPPFEGGTLATAGQVGFGQTVAVMDRRIPDRWIWGTAGFTTIEPDGRIHLPVRPGRGGLISRLVDPSTPVWVKGKARQGYERPTPRKQEPDLETETHGESESPDARLSSEGAQSTSPPPPATSEPIVTGPPSDEAADGLFDLPTSGPAPTRARATTTAPKAAASSASVERDGDAEADAAQDDGDGPRKRRRGMKPPRGTQPLGNHTAWGGPIRPERLLYAGGTPVVVRDLGDEGIEARPAMAVGVVAASGQRKPGRLQVVRWETGEYAVVHPALVSPRSADAYAGLGTDARERQEYLDYFEQLNGSVAYLPPRLVKVGDIVQREGDPYEREVQAIEKIANDGRKLTLLGPEGPTPLVRARYDRVGVRIPPVHPTLKAAIRAALNPTAARPAPRAEDQQTVLDAEEIPAAHPHATPPEHPELAGHGLGPGEETTPPGPVPAPAEAGLFDLRPSTSPPATAATTTDGAQTSLATAAADNDTAAAAEPGGETNDPAQDPRAADDPLVLFGPADTPVIEPVTAPDETVARQDAPETSDATKASVPQQPQLRPDEVIESGDLEAVRVYWRQLATDPSLTEQRRRELLAFADDASLALSPGGTLVVREIEPNWMFIQTASGAPLAPVTSTEHGLRRYITSSRGGKPAALEVAGRWETELLGADGTLFDWATADLDTAFAQWRTPDGERLSSEMRWVKGKFDVENGHNTDDAYDYRVKRRIPNRPAAGQGRLYVDEVQPGDVISVNSASEGPPAGAVAIDIPEIGRGTFVIRLDDGRNLPLRRNERLFHGALPIVHHEGTRIGQFISRTQLRPGDRIRLTGLRFADIADGAAVTVEATIPPGFRAEDLPRLIDTAVQLPGQNAFHHEYLGVQEIPSRVLRLDAATTSGRNWPPALTLAAAYGVSHLNLIALEKTTPDPDAERKTREALADCNDQDLDDVAAAIRAFLDAAVPDASAPVASLHGQLAALAAARHARDLSAPSDDFVAGMNLADATKADSDLPLTGRSDEQIRSAATYARNRHRLTGTYGSDADRQAWAGVAETFDRELTRRGLTVPAPASAQNSQRVPRALKPDRSLHPEEGTSPPEQTEPQQPTAGPTFETVSREPAPAAPAAASASQPAQRTQEAASDSTTTQSTASSATPPPTSLAADADTATAENLKPQDRRAGGPAVERTDQPTPAADDQSALFNPADTAPATPADARPDDAAPSNALLGASGHETAHQPPAPATTQPNQAQLRQADDASPPSTAPRPTAVPTAPHRPDRAVAGETETGPGPSVGATADRSTDDARTTPMPKLYGARGTNPRTSAGQAPTSQASQTRPPTPKPTTPRRSLPRMRLRCPAPRHPRLPGRPVSTHRRSRRRETRPPAVSRCLRARRHPGRGTLPTPTPMRISIKNSPTPRWRAKAALNRRATRPHPTSRPPRPNAPALTRQLRREPRPRRASHPPRPTPRRKRT